MSAPPDDETLSVIREARAELWRELRPRAYLLDDGQTEWVEAFKESVALTTWVWDIGRQRGKTYAALVMACELCASTPGAIVRYCAKTKLSAASIVEPSMALILADCPEELRPRREGLDYVWPNGARLVVFGTDAESFARGRGPRTDLQLLDECGFYQDLVGVEAALLPSLMTTGGKTLYLSTPPESLGHPYVQRIRSAMASGNRRHDTFWSNPRVNHEAVIQAECQRLGLTREELLASTYFRREYLAELVAEESRAAIPAWTEELHRELVVAVPRPEHFDGTVAFDWGYQPDPSFALASWLDYDNATIVFEAELELRGKTPNEVAMAIKALEVELYGAKLWDGTLLGALDWTDAPEWMLNKAHAKAPRQPYLRVGDNDKLLLAGLSVDHGISILPTPKHDKHLAVSTLNGFFVERRIRIHPRCVRLIEQLYSTVWNRSRNEWERTDKDHGEAIDCAVYTARNTRWHRDPKPKAPLSIYEKHYEKVVHGAPNQALARAFLGRRK